ncbi:prephenate dehydratase [Glycomyces algeriensis]|uniref:Prephenate dehydratase n=1 Tax=Glycomyces algeriensis TaxID=256037 RepID=A0A9W6LFT6_9ACTN|nr:prephenate dehydratase [Glycomyces algeriensis]MDA1368449.1 prephenate dehydratase [Glycomyces algeriensis]MDR7353255.1 prephenate dehydratase [Glycomyces algeriensis]GLI40949.1 prephenate dehydratase [Glycomyces algeriensis]
MEFAYLGPRGTFTEAALRRLPAAKTATATPMSSIFEVLDAVRRGEVDAGFVPIENSQEGTVTVTVDELVGGDPLVIVGEVVLPVTFVLASEKPVGEITTVASMPVALAQVRKYLRRELPDAVVHQALSTAQAAQRAAGGEFDAAVCPPFAAEAVGLPVQAFDIGDNPNAATRFVHVVRPTSPPDPSGNDITSLVVYIDYDRVGALLGVLTEFAIRGINLTRIESRPTGEGLGRYAFFLDCTGHLADARMGEALTGLRRICADVRYLGSYPRDHSDKPVPPPAGLSDADFADAAAWLDRLRREGA